MTNKPKTNENEIVKEYTGLIVVQAVHFTPTNLSDFDDYMSAGRLGLLKAIRDYDETRDVKFSTYATVCIRNEIIREVKRAKGNNINPGSLESVAESPIGANWWEYMPSSLTKIELEAVRMRVLESCKLKEIGEKFGHSKQWAGNILRLAFAKIREAYE